jgi:large subunit ribosomal protein L21
MYAIVLIGSRQYKVSEGDIIGPEKLPRKNSGTISLDKVLLYSKGRQVKVGTPFLKSVRVAAEIIQQAKSKKTISFKYRRRKGKRWKKGFRQHITKLRIKEIIAK